MTTLHLRKSIGGSLWRRGYLLIALALTCFALSPAARGVCEEGCDTSHANTFLGDDALVNNSTGKNNTAVGSLSLKHNTNGTNNTALGASALTVNRGSSNTATGSGALFNNTIGTDNTANGLAALYHNIDGNDNTAIGETALFKNDHGIANTAIGYQALYNNAAVGSANTAVGFQALLNNNSGLFNTALGSQALTANTTGTKNTVVGNGAGTGIGTGSSNTVVGNGAGSDIQVDGSGNTILGDSAASSGGATIDNNIYIGRNVHFGGGLLFESGAIRIGDSMPYVALNTSNVFIAGIFGADVTAGQPTVKCNANGQLGTVSSSARFKKDIASMGKTSEAIFSLRPVTFHYKNDPRNIPAFGLIAEEVAKVSPDLVIRDREGKVYSVRYDDVNVMLLNEFLKEHRTMEALQAGFAQQQKKFQAIAARQQKQIDLLTAGLQKVSAQLEASKSAPQVVNNNQ